MDHLKEGIGLRGYGQKDPIREYQKEGYEMFMDMVYRIKTDTIEKLCRVQIQREEEIEEMQEKQRQDYIMSRGKTRRRQRPSSGIMIRLAGMIPAPAGAAKSIRSAADNEKNDEAEL